RFLLGRDEELYVITHWCGLIGFFRSGRQRSWCYVTAKRRKISFSQLEKELVKEFVGSGAARRLRRYRSPFHSLRMTGKVESLQILGRAWPVIASLPRVVRDEE